jgi:murein DD-endopeptidase MepM/ murein hydrolase activator NlpD
MKQEYFVVVLAHSLRGRLRRIHIPHQAVYAILALALLGCFSVFGFVASYARMAWKVANYNALKREADGLRVRYQSLQKVVSETNEQLASLQLYAKEVSVAYGIKQKLEGPADISAEGKLVPTFAESVQDYDFLRSTNLLALPSRSSSRLRPPGAQPSMWPVQGLITGPFGRRSDPFSDEGAFHKGVDIDHGGGIQTYYAHLSRIYVHAGQEVRRGDLLGAAGSTGRVTAPHLHYEVRVGGTPMNPRRYLSTAAIYQGTPRKDFPF